MTLPVLQRMATSLLAGSRAAPRQFAPASPSRGARASSAQSCTTFALRGCRRRAPAARLLAAGSSLAQRVVHRGAQLAIRRRACLPKQPQSKGGLVRSALSAGAAVLSACAEPRGATHTRSVVRLAQLVQASFLGVGAPEAFVIAIVALLVFGPKGLAEARGPDGVCGTGRAETCHR